MFTGIIEALGRVTASEPRGGDRRLQIATGTLPLDDVKLGDSICVSGVCLTAVAVDGQGFAADVSAETLNRTVLGELDPGAAVNLEKSLTPSSRLGGHLVSGHVDGVGEVLALAREARSWRLTVAAPAELGRYIAEKGSVCVDGISLTVNNVEGSRFAVNIVPHTFEVTTIGEYRVGRRVNLEVDIIARYLERLLTARSDGGGVVSEQLLRASGFIED